MHVSNIGWGVKFAAMAYYIFFLVWQSQVCRYELRYNESICQDVEAKEMREYQVEVSSEEKKPDFEDRVEV